MDWRILKAAFEKPKAPFVMEGADDFVIVLDDDPIKGNVLTAIANLRKAKTFQDLAGWFASALDSLGPAGPMGGSLSYAAENIDAIFAFADKLKQAHAVFDDQNADIEDRMEAARVINAADRYSVDLGNNKSVTRKIYETVTRTELDSVKLPLNGQEYGDLKLTEFRDLAQTVMARAGVAPQAALQRSKELQAEIDAASVELNAKVQPLIEAWTKRKEVLLKAAGYDDLGEQADNLTNFYQYKANELRGIRPIHPGYSYDDGDGIIADYNDKLAEWRRNWDALELERSQEVGKIYAQRRQVVDKAMTDAGDLNAELLPHNEAFNEFATKKREEIAEARSFAGKLKSHVLEASPVTKESADQWFNDMVMVTKNMAVNLKKRGYTPEKLKEDMTEFHRLTGGRLPRISFETKGGQRAAAQPTTGVVYVAGEFSKETLFHELAHVLEDDERTRTIANRFLDQRTGRTEEGKNKVVRLKDLTGNKGYKSSEVAYPDSFINPYVGKYYRDGAVTEVFSMGMQYFSTPENMAVLAEKDPDHFNFMLGYTATLPRLDKSKVDQQQQAMAEQKDAVVSSDVFLKKLDKQIEKAGDFWTKEGFLIESYLGGKRWYASWPGTKENTRNSTYMTRTEKNLKRALWLYIAAGKPSDGAYSLYNLIYYTFNKKVNVPKEIYQNQSLIEGGLP